MKTGRNKKICQQCGGLLKGYYQFYTCSDCYSKNGQERQKQIIKATSPEGCTHLMVLPNLENVYYKIEDGQWFIWSKFQNEPLHWCKASGVSENLLRRV